MQFSFADAELSLVTLSYKATSQHTLCTNSMSNGHDILINDLWT